ncbi:MAG: hypothetical protein JXA33_00840, partial [Anaerolineae bacterium]|nr:hypothetical protein [Anaerolineae bacterium]
DTLVAFTNQGRTFRLPVASISQTPVRAKGQRINSSITLREDEKIVALIPDSGGEHIAIVGERGWVTLIRASFVGKNLIPGTVYLDTKKHGPLAAACWANRDEDLFVVTAQGLAIRFPLARVSASGSLGIRLERDDSVTAITSVQEESGVFLIGDDGKGTIRLMSGFAANKNPGGGGKKAIKATRLAGMVTVDGETDIFVISQHSKIIRFTADEVPSKTGVVQGVNCIALRGDEVVACTASRNIKTEEA